MKNIILIGFMGAGKTTVGRRLAAKLKLPFVDTDEQIEKEQGRSIREIFEKEGEAFFRDLETEQLRKLGRKDLCQVISVGGGLPVQIQNHELLKELGTTVYLKADKTTLVTRLSGDTGRPLLQGGSLEEKIEQLMQERASVYEQVANFIIETDSKSLQETVRGVCEALHR